MIGFTFGARGHAYGKGPDSYPERFFPPCCVGAAQIRGHRIFDQLPSGERPDTLIIYSIPAIWFIDDDDDDLGAADDRLFNFTQRGRIIIKAAMMRLVPSKPLTLCLRWLVETKKNR